jgi:nucleotide-binding universal stress UspA family protein
MFSKIAVAFDESSEAQRALAKAIDLAKLVGAEITLITVVENLPAYVGYVSAVAPEVTRLLENERRAFYQDLHNRARERAEAASVALRSRVIEGSEVEALLSLIEDVRPDLVVLGLRQEAGGLSRFIGGTAHQLALRTRCDVLGVH